MATVNTSQEHTGTCQARIAHAQVCLIIPTSSSYADNLQDLTIILSSINSTAEPTGSCAKSGAARKTFS